MCSLTKAREAILKAHQSVLAAGIEHNWPHGLCDADSLLRDAASQISGEIANQLPERPIYEKHP